MANGNRTWTIWLAGIVATIFLTALSFLGSNVIANDKAARDRDSNIEAKIYNTERRIENHISEIIETQSDNHTEVLIVLERLATKIDKNGRTR